MEIVMQTKKRVSSSEITKTEALIKFKMDAVAILEIEVHAIQWALTTRD
jgi:hypothetical protein